MTNLKILAGAAAVFAGLSLRWNWWRGTRAGLPVLVYHKVGYPPRGSKLKKLWVTPAQFRRHIRYLLRRGYNTVLFSDLEAAFRGRKPLLPNPVLVTFDDGYRNNYSEAFPVLRETGAKANIFLVCASVGKANTWHDPSTEPWVDMMDWDMIKEMAASGLVEFGSHTMTHPDLPRIAADEAVWEIRESKKRLEEKTGSAITAFAYPYGAGAYVPEIRKTVLEAGYLFDFAFRQGKTPWPWKPEDGPIKRLFIRGDDNMFDFHLNVTRGKARF